MIALKSINILHCKISKLQLKNTKSSENEQKRKNKMDHFKQLSKRKKRFYPNDFIHFEKLHSHLYTFFFSSHLQNPSLMTTAVHPYRMLT